MLHYIRIMFTQCWLNNRSYERLHCHIYVPGIVCGVILHQFTFYSQSLVKISDVSIQGVSEIPPGENIVEVYYKGSKSSTWNLQQNQAEAELCVLAVPVH